MASKKINTSITWDEKIFNEVEELRSPKKEDRSFSKMSEILVKEALDARKKKEALDARK